MKNGHWFGLAIAIGCMAVVGTVPSAMAQKADAAGAKAILDLAGADKGLCIHLGCGREASASLTADLASGSKMVVHGIALDDAAMNRARKAIETQGMAGRAMVEKVDVSPLPYLNDLADLVVIEDFAALSARGLKMEDVLRVTAPNGVVCTFADGKWTKTVKPRPKEMDDWTHPNHGADGNLVSQDKLVAYPLGYRWIDGLPMNLNRWASCRAWVAAGGRLFLLTANVLENVGPQKNKSHYLSAHNAWNGLPLWKVDCERTDDGAFLTPVNFGALVADSQRVYTVQKDKVVAFDAATGKKVTTFDNKYPAERLTLLDDVLVASCWESKAVSKAPSDCTSLWATWTAKSDVGTVEAFNAKTGASLWKLEYPSQQVIAAEKTVYLLSQKGSPPTERSIVALDLATGKERWRVPHTKFGEEPDLQINTAGKGYVVIAKRGDPQGLGAPKKPEGEKPRLRAVFVLSAADGSLLWQINPSVSFWTPVVDGALWYQNKKYDVLTGKQKGNIGWGLGDQFCTPQMIVNDYFVRPRGGQMVQVPEGGPSKEFRYAGARGACIEGMVAANGMFYTAQNNCECMPGQIYGFLAMGPSGAWPTAADFEKPVVEKGPAFGKVATPAAAEDKSWPTYRGDAERSASTKAALPAGLKELWKTPVAKPAGGPLSDAWKARLGSCISAPVAADGLVVVAACDAGQIVAMNAADGKIAWTVSLGGRVDTPPTLYKGVCLVGCHDGWVYALAAKDGQLVWRTRVAPWERRMVAYGQVESVWPVVGTVLVHDGVAYVTAGRSSESDGGVALDALDPMTGQPLWAKAIAPGPQRMNDMLAIRDGQLAWYNLRLDPKTGAVKTPATFPASPSQGGMLDGTWTEFAFRRSGKAFWAGSTIASMLAWNEAMIVTPVEASTPTMAKNTNLWATGLPKSQQVDAMALASNASVFAGRTPAGKTNPAGFLAVLSATDGKKLTEISLATPPTYNGLAVAGGCVFVSLQDGSVVCLGK